MAKDTVSESTSVAAKVPIAVWFSAMLPNAVVVITGASLTSVTVTVISWVDVRVPSVIVAVMLYTLFVLASAGLSKFGVAAKARAPDELNVKSPASSPARVVLKLTESPSASEPVRVATGLTPSSIENESLDVKIGLLSLISIMFTETSCLVKLLAESVAVISIEKLDWDSKSGAVLNSNKPLSLFIFKLSESAPAEIVYEIVSLASASVAVIELTVVWFSLTLKLEREVKIGNSSFISLIDTVIFWLSLKSPSETLRFIEYDDLVSKSGLLTKERLTLFSALLVKTKELASSPLILNTKILLSASVAVISPTERKPSSISKLAEEVMLGAVLLFPDGGKGVALESLSPPPPPATRANKPTPASTPYPPTTRVPLFIFLRRASRIRTASSWVISPLSIKSSNSLSSFKYSSTFSIISELVKA